MTVGTELQRTRRAFDRTVLEGMEGPVEVASYRTAADLAADRPLPVGDGGPALAYRVRLAVPTLIDRDRWSTATTVAINSDVPGYPVGEPLVWAVDRPYPWSPHWHAESGRFCVGPFWREHAGKALLGQLVIHVARLLNWDERLTKGYTGWNAAAVAHYWARGATPLVDGQQYPVIPHAVLTGTPAPAGFAFTTDRPTFRRTS